MRRSRPLPRAADATLRALQGTIASHPRLTRAEECELATLAQAGDIAARDRMACANVRLVLATVPHFLTISARVDYGLSAEDLVQEGMIGLHDAIMGFDPSRGCRFSTYAVTAIRRAIMAALNEGTLIRVTAHGKRNAAGSGDDAPGVVESIDASSHDGGPAPRHDPPSDAPSPEDQAGASILSGAVADAMATLPPRMRYIIRARHGFWPSNEGMTLEAIGEKLGLTRERVRQIESEAHARLRRALAS